MGIMPHKDVQRALDLALSLDIPFWPQLPNVSFFEDMYAQTSERFPGIAIDQGEQRVSFDSSRFLADMASYAECMNYPDYFQLSESYSTVYHRFLALDLGKFTAIRGQVTGPVSFGFRIVDESQRPIIYDDSARTMLFDFIQRKWNAQVRQLREKNANAFVWADEPGLGWIFSGMTGYDDVLAKRDYRAFLEGVEGVKALHLCANVNLPYLLELGTELVSFDAYQIETMPKAYSASVAEFLKGGGIIAWGIVPTDSTSSDKESVDSIASRLLAYWGVLSRESGISEQHIASRSLLAPARCCLKNVGLVGAAGETKPKESAACQITSIEEGLVETAFSRLKLLSQTLRDQFRL